MNREKLKAEMGAAGVVRLHPALARRLGRRARVLEAMWAGKCTKEIAAELGISPKTVEYHRENLYRRFGVDNPVSLCRRAIRMGILCEERRGKREERGRRGNADTLTR